MKVKYAIDNYLFETGSRKIYVTNSRGILDSPKPKEPFKVSYPNRDGEEVYFGNGNRMAFEPRQIELECAIVSNDATALITDFNSLVAIFRGTSARRLKRLYIQVESNYPLVYDVYLSDEIVLNKKWKDGQIVGVFTLKVIETMPTKSAYHLTDYNFLNTYTPKNLVANSRLGFTTNQQIYGVKQVDVFAGKTYTMTVKARNEVAGQVLYVRLKDSGGTTFRTFLTFNTTSFEIKSFTFTAVTTMSLFFEASKNNADTAKSSTVEWYMFQETSTPATSWVPSDSDTVDISLTVQNISTYKKTFKVSADGTEEQKSLTILAGATGVFSFNANIDTLKSMLRNPVVTIDDPTHLIVSCTKTLIKPFAV